VKNISMVFINGHFSQGRVRPNVPAMVEIGGIQVKPTPDKLPEVSSSIKSDQVIKLLPTESSKLA